MEPLRHTLREDPLDLRGKLEEIRADLERFLVAEGEGVLVGQALAVGAASLAYTSPEGQGLLRDALAEAGGRLREAGEVLRGFLDDERLGALAEDLAEDHPLGERLSGVRAFLDALDAALESLSLLEETPAAELDLAHLHATLRELAKQASAPMPDALAASHVTELEIRI